MRTLKREKRKEENRQSAEEKYGRKKMKKSAPRKGKHKERAIEWQKET